MHILINTDAEDKIELNMLGLDLLTVKTVNVFKKSLYFQCHEELGRPATNGRDFSNAEIKPDNHV